MQPETSWTAEFAQAFKNSDELFAFLGWKGPVNSFEVSKSYPLFVPRRIAQKIKILGPDSSIAKEFLPSDLELDGDLNDKGFIDPIGDQAFQKAPQLIHRYPSRALFTATSICPVHCRYCFRKNELDAGHELFQSEFSKTLEYLKEHPEISEIIFTGGDPFTLTNAKLENYLEAFANLGTIKDVRFHTRYPVILPERIDQGLVDLLMKANKKFRTTSVAIHANHADEFDPAADAAIERLQSAGVQLLSQTVLLRGVNDCPDQLVTLIEHFIQLKVRPYYLHHPDRVKGGMHFYLPLQKGRQIYGALRPRLPGWALPHYVIDVPGGSGKVGAFNPESTSYSGQLLSLELIPQRYQEPDFFI